WSNTRLLLGRRLSTNIAELAAEDNRFHCRVKAVFVGGEFLLHFLQQRFVRKLHLAAQSVAKQFAAELANDVLPTIVDQVFSQTVKALDRFALKQRCSCVGQLRTEAAYRIVLL